VGPGVNIQMLAVYEMSARIAFFLTFLDRLGMGSIFLSIRIFPYFLGMFVTYADVCHRVNHKSLSKFGLIYWDQPRTGP